MDKPQEVFIAYEPGHVDEAQERVEKGAMTVCLDFLVERELKKKRIPYISLRDIIDTEIGEEEWWMFACKIARGWYLLPALKFFEYEGIEIAKVPEPVLVDYLCRLFYYVRVYIALKKKYPDARFFIPARIVDDASSAVCLASFQLRAVVDAARMVNLRSTILYKPVASRKKSALPSIIWKPLLVKAYNMLIVFFPRRAFKIYASEYWSHIGSVIERMDDTELVLMESSELIHIPWRQLLTHRIRTRHPNEVIEDAERRTALKISKKFEGQWEIAKKEVALYLAGVREELDWSPVLEACEYLVLTYAPKIITDINALHRIMKEEKPDIVLQLASAGLYHSHFFLMARVAAQLGIPSLELQHAGATVDPRSTYSCIETDYLATYGTDVDSWHERIGHARNRLIPAGSPRFDQYVNRRTEGLKEGKRLFVELGLDTARPVLFAAVPFSGVYVSVPDSYQLSEFFKAIRAVQSANPALQVLLKFRADNHIGAMYEYLQELFPADMVMVGNEDIFALLCASDAVVCSNSTIIYQTVLVEKPLVLYPWRTFDRYHAQVYERAAPLFYTAQEAVDSISRVFTDPSYHEELMKRQKEFLKGYSFDGKSSARVATLLHELPKKSRK